MKRTGALSRFPLTAGCVILASLLTALVCVKKKEAAKMTQTIITEDVYGTMANGDTVKLYTLRNSSGLAVRITNYGGIITGIMVPDKNGEKVNVVLGKETLNGYLKGHPYFGAIIGRYANRIAGCRYTLDGQEYVLSPDNGKPALHGGRKGFDKKLWEPEMITEGGRAALKLTHTSPDGDMGHPGKLDVTVTYELVDNRLLVTYEAVTDKPTHINLTNHSYYNMAGMGNALEQTLVLNAGKYTPVDKELIPTGELKDVTGTPFDFRKEEVIGTRAGETELGFYDHNYVLDASGEEVLAACLKDPAGGRYMNLYTTEPGVQFYSGNKKGVCLETQHFPDSPNQPAFPSTVLRPGEKFFSRTIMEFGAE